MSKIEKFGNIDAVGAKLCEEEVKRIADEAADKATQAVKEGANYSMKGFSIH